jgi:hypothetical protein
MDKPTKLELLKTNLYIVTFARIHEYTFQVMASAPMDAIKRAVAELKEEKPDQGWTEDDLKSFITQATQILVA